MNGNAEDEDGSNPMIIILGALIGIALLIIGAIVTAAGFFLCKRKNSTENNFFLPPQKIQTDSFQVPMLRENNKNIKLNNSQRKSFQDILPLDEINNTLKPFTENNDDDVMRTAVIRKNRGSAARQIRNSLSLSSSHNDAVVVEIKPIPIPVEIKPLNLCNQRNSDVIIDDSTEGNVSSSTVTCHPNNDGETVKKTHARVTLNSNGDVLKCVIEGKTCD